MAGLDAQRVLSWNDVSREVLNEYIQRQVVSGDELMLAKLHMKKGATVSTHSHPNEQFSYILKGKVRFQYGENLGHEVEVGAGELLHIPSNVLHNAVCLEDAIDLDIFTPPRKDWATSEGNRYLSGNAVSKQIKGASV